MKQNAGSSVQLGINEGGTKDYGSVQNLNPGQWTTVTSYIAITGSASQARAFIQCNATCDLDWYEVYPLVTRYRIIQKTITDQVTNSSYTTLYSYEGGAVNDTTHSDYVENDPSGTHLMTKPNSEFRGHSHVTETDADGRKVETWYSQDDINKGRAYKTQLTDISGNIYTEGDITYTSQENQASNLPHPEDQPPNSDLKIYWVYVSAEENRTQNGGGIYVATKNEYQYVVSDQNGTQYGNRTRTISYWWNGISWNTHQGSITHFYPKISNGTPEASRYLTGLQAYTNSYDCPGSCDWELADLIAGYKWLYDDHSDYAALPDDGKLTGERNLIRYVTPPRTDPRYADTEYTYDSWGNRTITTQYTGETDIDNFGNGSGAQATLTCYGSGQAINGYACNNDGYYTYPVWGRNAKLHLTTYSYDKTKSVPLSLTDPNSAVTSATYDEFGRILTIIRPGDSSNYPTAVMSYHNAQDPYDEYPYWTEAKQLIYFNGDGYPIYYIMRKYYSGIGQLLQTQGVGAMIGTTTQDILSDTFYDSSGRVSQQTVAYNVNTGSYFHQRDSSKPSILTTYDTLGRTLKSEATDHTTTTYAYSDSYTNGTPFLYTEVTNPRGYTTQSKSDIWGKVVKVTPPTGPTVSYTYDAADRLWITTRGGAITTLTYDFGGRKESMADPDMGGWIYTYDALGNLKTQTDARSCMTTLSYDNLNRLTGKTYSGTGCSTTAVSYTYDAGTNGKGHRTGMTDGSGNTSWTYDNRGRMTQETKTITGSGTFVTQWTYNSADLVTTMRYPANNSSGLGETVTFTYLPQMMLDTATGTSPYVNNTDYDAAGRVDVRDLGLSSGNPVIRVDYTYFDWTDLYGQGRLEQITSGSVGTPDSLQDLRYTYDANGNVLTTKDYKAGNPQTQTFTYDWLDRLISGQASGGSYGTYSSQSYNYNPTTGNLASRAGVNYTYGDANHDHAVTDMSSGESYDYDENGNQTQRVISGSTYNLSYDAENRLVGVSGAVTATFVYDGDGNRVKGTVSGTTIAYIGNYLEWTGSVNTMRKFYYAGSTRVAMRTGASTLKFLLGDHLGSTSITTDSNGAFGSEIRYYPWGGRRYANGSIPTTFQYTGQRLDSGIGLYFYGARYYDPAAGRFIQPDTNVPESQGVQALDRYAYVNNSPVTYTDPSGHMMTQCGADNEECGASQAQINYETQRYYYENCSSGYGGGCPNYTEAIVFTAVGLVTAGAAEPVVDAVGAAIAETVTTATTAACADGDCTNEGKFIVKTYNQLKEGFTEAGLQVHHIIEQRFAPALNQSYNQARNWLSVVLTPEEHQVITNAWRNAIGYSNSNNAINTLTVTIDDIWNAAQDIYANYPELIEAARITLFGK